MKTKVALVVGLAAGYVLGARAGRRRFESIKGHAREVWESDSVQSAVSSVQEKAAEVARDQGTVLKDKVTEAVDAAKKHSKH